MNFNRKAHWENVYETKMPTKVSWYQTQPTVSLDFIISTGINYTNNIIDVGGGASVLVDKLFDKGFKNLTVLDISSKAIGYAKERLKKRADDVTWIESDVTEHNPSNKYDLWHDRAVFHFLTDVKDRRKYVKCMNQALNPGAHIIISTFTIAGPPKCSGLNIEQYDTKKMKNELGKSFKFIKSVNETHVTPWGADQKFIYCYFKKKER